jgi:hypothetical protein
VGPLDDVVNHPPNGLVSLVEEIGEPGRIAVDAQNELREVVRADGEAVESGSELFGEDDV